MIDTLVVTVIRCAMVGLVLMAVVYGSHFIIL